MTSQLLYIQQKLSLLLFGAVGFSIVARSLLLYYVVLSLSCFASQGEKYTHAPGIIYKDAIQQKV